MSFKGSGRRKADAHSPFFLASFGRIIRSSGSGSCYQNGSAFSYLLSQILGKLFNSFLASIKLGSSADRDFILHFIIVAIKQGKIKKNLTKLFFIGIISERR
jgi:hypothetical protein